jgi:hypothetical protein
MAQQQQPIEIPVKLGIGEIKQQLKEIKGQIANTFDPEEIAKLSERAGELKDNLTRVNEQVGIYASGSPFEQSANALGLVGSQLASLDFEGAAESAALLQKKITSITPEDVTKQMKGLQDTFSTLGKVSGQAITGLIKNVGTLAKSFLSFGVSLLANPIFLITAAVVAIVGAIALLMNKLGLLKPVLKAVGDAFNYIKGIINAVVDAFGVFTDWLGITDIAAENSAKKQTAAAEQKANAYEKASKNIQFSLEEEIKIAQIQGKETEALEIKKQRNLKETAIARKQAIEAKIAENKLTEELGDEEVKKLKENLDAQKDIIKKSISEIKLIKIKEAEEDKKAEADKQKAETENAKQRAANAKQYSADRLAAQRLIRDLEIEALEDGINKDLAVNKEKYKRLIEDTKANEKYTATEKAKILNQLREQEKVNNEELLIEDRKKKVAETEAELKEYEDLFKLKAQKDKELKQREKMASLELATAKNEDDLNAFLNLLEAKKQAELSNTELTLSERALIEENYRQQKLDAEQKASEKERAIREETQKAAFDVTYMGLTAIQNLSDVFFSIKSKNLKKGTIEEEQAARKQFEINKKIQLASAIITGIQSVMNAFNNGMKNPVPLLGPLTAGIYAGAAGIAAAANIAKISASKFEGGSAGSAATPSTPEAPTPATTAAGPSFRLFGNANNLNTMSANQQQTQTAQSGQNINVTAFVVADELTAQQESTNNIMNNATL